MERETERDRWEREAEERARRAEREAERAAREAEREAERAAERAEREAERAEQEAERRKERAEKEKEKGTFHNMGFLDLSWAKTMEDIAHITSIHNIGVLRVPEQLYELVCSLPMHNVGIIERVPSGDKIEISGQSRVSGEFLAAGEPDTMLLVTGQLFVTPPLESIGFKEVRVTGQMFLPRGSEKVLTGKLRRLTGQILYYRGDAGAPRVFSNGEEIGREFLELLPEPAPFIIMGDVSLDDDISVDLLRSKVVEITLAGRLHAPRHLLPLLQILAVDKVGAILAKKGSAGTETVDPWDKDED
jgi:hypothetical protein